MDAPATPSDTTTAVPESGRLSLVRALRAARDPVGFFRAAARHGDPFTVTLPGAGAVIVTGSPGGARQLFQAAPDTFEPVLPNPIEPVVGSGSLILLGGERHARERKLVSGPLCGRRMRGLGRAIEAAARHALDAQVDRVVSAQELTRSLTLEVIVRAVFGVDDPERQRVFRRATLDALDAYRPALALVPQLRRSWLGFGWRRFVAARERLDGLLRDEIARRRRVGGGDDVLSALLELRYDDGEAMSDAAIVDQLRTLLVAGHETTATALVWALHYVHADPSIAARLGRELADVEPGQGEVIARLPYLSAVCQEALRIHPIVPIVLRRLRAPLRFCGRDLGPGTSVGVAVTLLHHDPEHYPEPARFDPERFLGRTLPPHVYAPFGGGHRRCLGAGFAAYEMKIALAVIMRAGPWSAVSSRRPRPVLRGITMAPDCDLRFARA